MRFFPEAFKWLREIHLNISLKKKYHKNLMNLLNQDLNSLIFIFNLFFWTINAALT